MWMLVTIFALLFREICKAQSTNHHGGKMRLACGVSGIFIALGGGAVCGQEYPQKPIHFVTTGIGSSTDFMSRVIGQGIAASMGQSVVVDNRASAIATGEIVAKAAPDGYTLLVTGTSFWVGPLFQKTPFDPVRDFAPITLAVGAPQILVIHPALPVKTTRELIALAKARPGALNYASGGAGTAAHLAAELFNAMAGIKIVRVSYKAVPSAITDLLAGEVQMTFGTPGVVTGHMKSGRLRGLAVTSSQPSALFPELPTIASAGLTGFKAETLWGIFAPAKTSTAIINRVHQEVVQTLKKEETKTRFLANGTEVIGSTPAEFAAVIKAEMSSLAKLIKEANLRVD